MRIPAFEKNGNPMLFLRKVKRGKIEQLKVLYGTRKR